MQKKEKAAPSIFSRGRFIEKICVPVAVHMIRTELANNPETMEGVIKMFGFNNIRECIDMALVYIGNQDADEAFFDHVTMQLPSDVDSSVFSRRNCEEFFRDASQAADWGDMDQADVLESYIENHGPEIFLEQLQETLTS